VNANGAICGTLRLAHSANGRDFFYDTKLRAAFLGRVSQILQHRNSITGTPYRYDPTVLAWENCDSCATVGGRTLTGAWSEQLGVFIKGIDKYHLYEDGAFAGHIGPGAKVAVDADVYATPTVDIVGDRLTLTGDPQMGRSLLGQTVDGVVKSGRAYVLDGFGWSPALWKTLDDLESWLSDISRNRSVAGAFTGMLQGHADGGGFLPAPPSSGDGEAALYFPGIDTADMALATMRERGRALRRFNFDMTDVTETPTYLLAPKPEILSAAGGHVVWRGAAGAADYTVERSSDPNAPGSWSVVCDMCATPGSWDDPHFVSGSWYRVMPFNINGHKSSPSEAVQGK
jgi:mannan endo-1,4-beta-mannosidase